MAYYISAICIPKNQKKKKLKNGFPWDAAVVGSIHEIKKKNNNVKKDDTRRAFTF